MLGMRQDIPASFSPVSEEAFPQPDAATGQMIDAFGDVQESIFFQASMLRGKLAVSFGVPLSFGNSTVHWHKTPIESNNVFGRDSC